jgi:hypothetical protein
VYTDVSEEHRFALDLQGATSKKDFVVVTAVKTSNLTNQILV